jgi:hypothetical protein
MLSFLLGIRSSAGAGAAARVHQYHQHQPAAAAEERAQAPPARRQAAHAAYRDTGMAGITSQIDTDM